MSRIMMPGKKDRKRVSWSFGRRVVVPAVISVLLPLSAGAQDWKIVDAQTLHDWLQTDSITLVNVMSRMECLDHRIKGSLCIACEEFRDNISGIPRDRKLVIYCESEGCNRSCTAAGDALEEGLEEVYVLGGGMPAWKRAGFTMESVQRIPREFIKSVKAERMKDWLALNPNYIILDIRSEYKYLEEHLEGAINIPFYQLHSRYYELPWDQNLFVVDDNGLRSFLASCYLSRKGFPVVRLFGGMEKWRALPDKARQVR